MARFHLHLLLLQGWCLALLARGGPIHHSDHSASLNITLSADSSTKPTALLVKQLITTSFVETMPAFLATQSARLELVNGNPCYTVETLDHTEVGNLMARKTCWCMTVIEVPVTPSPMNKPPMAIATATATPVYTTTVTVFANSVIEAVFESMKGPHDKLTTSSRHRFKPKMKSSISWLGPSSSSPDNELGSSTWIPENIISPSWPTNTLVNDASIDPSQSLISGIDPSWNSSTLTIIEPTATLALSSLEPFTDVLASPSWKVANWDSSEIISSGGMQLSLPLEPSVGEESASYRWSELPTPVLGTIELTDESSIASTDGKNVLSTGTSVSIFGEVATPEMPVDNTTGTLTLDTEPSPSIAGASDLFSSRSGNIDSENLTAEPTSLTTLSTINLINTWDVVATSQLSYRSVGDVTEWSQEGTPILSTVTEWYQEGSPILSTATYASSADWETDESRVPPLWSSKGDSSDLRFFATPPWAHNSSLVTESDSESTWKIETPTLALDIMSSTGGEPPGSETIPCSPLGSEAFRPLLASQNTSNQSSIYGDEITTDSIIKTPLPILSTTDEFKILPSLTANPTYVSAILLPISPSIIGTALATMDTSSAHDVETWVTSSGISLEASSSGFPTSRLSATSSVNEARLTGSPAAGFSITPSSNLLPSISTNVPVEGSYINVSWYTTILSSEKSSTSVSTWTHTIQATFVPTPTNKPPISSFAPDFSNTTKPPPREQDPHYWIQTELRIPVGVNSTDTPALVKNLAFLYERAYAYQYRRQRRFARPTSIKLIHVIIDYKDRNITLVYVLYHRGRLVPAIEAVETIRVVRKADMEKTLKHGVIVKAKLKEKEDLARHPKL
ncbi:hypothetical protein BIW11_03125 [Tropilaelaps mercedesae]|uniref:Uncharacterized protein n=1 Tax=Tropilaelaps mercedesae TaxID=418985 RepID=A0A1V9XS58_9ACAR|nr:hypothetical protein BIW11_03125 [Tropilaelaps mercedesae]